MNRVLTRYFRTPLVLRILLGFVAGSIIGIVLWGVRGAGPAVEPGWKPYIEPFGAVFVNMLKMIVIPVIFFSLIVGAASLPLKKFGRIGVKVIGWYLFCSLLAAGVGVLLALTVNPGSGTDLTDWESLAGDVEETQASELESKAESPFRSLLLSMFENPFGALANGNFLPIIVFAILFGLAIRVIIEREKDSEQVSHMKSLVGIFAAVRDAIFKLVDWILEYSPIGVLALSIMNFGLYGPKIFGPYIKVTLGVVIGILAMVLVVYSILLRLTTGKNPFYIFKRIQEAMIMAFMTRSSAATLPVSLKVAKEELKVREELASFSLPLGATINMDGVCVHLPMFAVLAANLFNLHLTASGLVVLVMTTVLASIGAGGVPGGSLMLLFIILGTMGLNEAQVAVIVALALGINPILDMFETMNNITGDLVCTYVVADNEDLLDSSE